MYDNRVLYLQEDNSKPFLTIAKWNDEDYTMHDVGYERKNISSASWKRINTLLYKHSSINYLTIPAHIFIAFWFDEKVYLN